MSTVDYLQVPSVPWEWHDDPDIVRRLRWWATCGGDERALRDTP